MSILDELRRRAAERATGMRVVLAEGDDPRVVRAAEEAQRQGLCRPLLVASEAAARGAAAEAGVELTVPCLDPADDPEMPALLAHLGARLAESGLAAEALEAMCRERLHYAALLVAVGRADGAVMGAVATTGDTVRAALRAVGRGAWGAVSAANRRPSSSTAVAQPNAVATNRPFSASGV